MFNNKSLIQKYETQIRTKENNIKKFEKTIRSYGFRNCKKMDDFKVKKIKLEIELEEIKVDILKAGSKYDASLVAALKNKESRIKTKINNINDILVLLHKIDALKTEILALEDEIKKLRGTIKPIGNEREQMNIVLKALRNNYSFEDAANLANVKQKRIVNWIHEGRNRTNKNKIYFYKQYSRIKSNKGRKIDKILKHLRNGKTKDEACKLSYVSVKAFDRWYSYGKLGKDKLNIDFYNNVRLIKESNENLMDNFLNEKCKSKNLDLTDSIAVKTYPLNIQKKIKVGK